MWALHYNTPALQLMVCFLLYLFIYIVSFKSFKTTNIHVYMCYVFFFSFAVIAFYSIGPNV